MKRNVTEELIKWKNSKYRKPLLIRGARQVGKTYIVKEFGEKYYENLVYFNFDHDSELFNIFQNTKDPQRIIDQLSVISGKTIKPLSTLIFLDEIQECPNALNSLKYFYENANEYNIIGAGSLLGIKLSHVSFPVGKVDYIDLTPMSFSEFLIADDCENYVEFMKNISSIIDFENVLHTRLIEKLKIYYVIGGMPEVVSTWVSDRDIENASNFQRKILLSYENDFSKHTTDSETNKISLIWNSIPSQLAKENKKFLYQVIKKGARAREYEYSLNWLVDANILYKVYNVSDPKLPLKAYQDLSSFKIYLGDVGLLHKHSNLSNEFLKNDNFYKEFKGSLTENFVLNHLVKNFDIIPYYYTFEKYEIDFLIQYKNEIIPVEVKSGNAKNNTSLTKYNDKYNPKISIRFSMNDLKLDGKILNVPLYMVEYLEQLLDIALNN